MSIWIAGSQVLQEATEFFFVLSVPQTSKVSQLPVSVPNWVRQKPVLGSTWKAGMLDGILLFPSWGRSHEWGILSWSKLSCANLVKALSWIKLNGFCYSFQHHYSCLCSSLEYYNFLIVFWSSQKDSLYHLLLSSWCLCGGMRFGLPIYLVDVTPNWNIFESELNLYVIYNNRDTFERGG